MDIKDIPALINKIEKIVGTCFYDEDDINEDSEIIEFYSDEYGELGFEIDKDTGLISVFMSFGYYDFNKEELERGYYDTEEVENETRTRLLESSTTLYFKAHSVNYIVSVWDDDHYMCPGYVARVGFFREEYSDEMIQEFLMLYKSYSSTIGCLNNIQLRRFILECICHNHNIKVTGDTRLTVGPASVIFRDNVPANSNIEYYYMGKENFLFSVSGQHYAAEVCPIEIFIEAQNMCELFEDISFFFDNLPLFGNSTLQAIGTHMVLYIQANADINQLYSQIEESTALINYSSIIPFASEKFRKIFSEEYGELLGSFTGENPLIITEGSTDWKHMKKYWELYIKQSCIVDFFDYEPGNSSKIGMIKQEMGSAALHEMCRAYSKMKLGKVFIFIADRDEPKIVKEMSNESSPYKYWGNGVYSLVLPIPEHRISTPEICIEHYYSDVEIKTFYVCADKKERRLFLGNDFDKYGRNIENGLLCVKRSLCGVDSIKVIDGSSDTRVISMTENNDINYALSKQEFAARSTIIKNSPTFNAFSKLFGIIQEITQDSKRKIKQHDS